MSVPPATEMFQFAGFASRTYGFSAGYPLARVGCPIRRSRDHRSLASPPGFSQRAASFIASQCQGIHQMPFSSLDPQMPRARPNRPGPQHPHHRRAQGQAPDQPAGETPAKTVSDRTRRDLVSHEDTSRTDPDAGSHPRPEAVRLGHIRKSASPFNQHHPAASARPRRVTPPGRPAAPEQTLFLLRMSSCPMAEARSSRLWPSRPWWRCPLAEVPVGGGARWWR